jgi:hypothetical protein
MISDILRGESFMRMFRERADDRMRGDIIVGRRVFVHTKRGRDGK